MYFSSDGIAWNVSEAKKKKTYDACYPILYMCLKKDLYITWKGKRGNRGVVVCLNLVKGLITGCVSNTRDWSEFHGICSYISGRAFVDLRQVKILADILITTIAWTGDERCLLGSSSQSCFGQPVVLVAENEKNLFLCDVQYGCIILTTGLQGTLFLSCLNKLFLEFVLKSQKNLQPSQTTAYSIRQIEQCLEFPFKTICNVQARYS